MNLVIKFMLVTFILISGKANAEETEHFPRHHLGVFAGVGIEKEHCHSESGYALGLEYEFRFGESTLEPPQ